MKPSASNGPGPNSVTRKSIWPLRSPWLQTIRSNKYTATNRITHSSRCETTPPQDRGKGHWRSRKKKIIQKGSGCAPLEALVKQRWVLPLSLASTSDLRARSQASLRINTNARFPSSHISLLCRPGSGWQLQLWLIPLQSATNVGASCKLYKQSEFRQRCLSQN